MLTRGQKSQAVRLHNTGVTIPTMVPLVKAPSADITEYLSNCRGWPGRISTPKVDRRAQLKRLKELDRYESVGKGMRPTPSMPKFRCLERPE